LRIKEVAEGNLVKSLIYLFSAVIYPEGQGCEATATLGKGALLY